MFLLVIAVFVGLSNGQFPDSEYCSIPCLTGQHTMCSYEPVGPNCRQVESLMNENGRMKILSLHNSFRELVTSGKQLTKESNAPQSSNMRQLYWDFELEAIAERWASQCNYSFNDECREVARFKVGQVMSKSRVLYKSLDYYDTLLNKIWFAEVGNLKKKNVLNYKSERGVIHVAQILSADTARIGCSDVLTKPVNMNWGIIRVTVCNYGPAVISGEELYKIGEPCSDCPGGTMCRGPYSKYPHLCSEYRHFDIAQERAALDENQMQYDRDTMNIDDWFTKIHIDDQSIATRRSNHDVRVKNPSVKVSGQRALDNGPESPNDESAKKLIVEDGLWGQKEDDSFPFGGRELNSSKIGFGYGPNFAMRQADPPKPEDKSAADADDAAKKADDDAMPANPSHSPVVDNGGPSANGTDNANGTDTANGTVPGTKGNSVASPLFCSASIPFLVGCTLSLLIAV